MLTGHRPWSPGLAAAVACGSGGSGRVSGRAPRSLPCPRRLPQGPRRGRAGGRRMVGGRTPVRGVRSPRTSAWPQTSPSACAGHQPSGRRSFRKQRTVNPLTVPARYNFLYTLKAGPAGGRLRRPSSRRQRHDGNRGTGLTLRPRCLMAARPEALVHSSARSCPQDCRRRPRGQHRGEPG
jgi:hypothetical protein